MSEPAAAASRPPPDLDARYSPYAPFAEWQRSDADLLLVDEAAVLLDRECRDADAARSRPA